MTSFGGAGMPSAILVSQVRYIKLGETGEWEADCVKDGTIRLGFGTWKASRFKLCRTRNWNALRAVFLREGNDRTRAGTFTGQIKAFFEDDGTILWITFHGEHLYWGFLDSHPAEADSDSTWRTLVDGWRC